MRSVFRFWMFLLVTTLLVCNAWADTAAGDRADESGDYAIALQQWREAAQQGDAGALMQLGRMYEQGTGVAKDKMTAFILYRVATLQGHPRAEEATNRVAGLLRGNDLVEGLRTAKRLHGQRRFVPPLPGVVAAPPRAPAPRPESPPPRADKQSIPAPGTALELRYTCNMELRYQDRGSGGKQDLTLYHPRTEPGYFVVGGYAQGNHDASYGCTLALRGESGGLLAKPAGWDRIWNDKGTGSSMDGSIWQALAPGPDYVCLGHVGQGGYGQPRVDNYRCVHRCLIAPVTPGNPIWTTAGTGAKHKTALYELPFTRTFVSIADGERPGGLRDLALQPACH